VVTRVLLPLVVTAGVYIMLRGHNLPGGGFIAGLVVAIAFIMQYMASGYAWAHSRAQIDAQVMIGGGVRSRVSRASAPGCSRGPSSPAPSAMSICRSSASSSSPRRWPSTSAYSSRWSARC
jgi:hypothetical protein